MHAVSVGEVNAARAIIESLIACDPGIDVILSTGTSHGQAHARRTLGRQVTCVVAPLDYGPAVRRTLAHLRPDALVCLETELWPNWLMTAHRQGLPTALVNGRISVRSIDGYIKIRPLMREILGGMTALSMVHAADARRLIRLGAPAGRISVNGNAKYDLLAPSGDTEMPLKMARLYNLVDDPPVFVAGSTRHPEEPIILDVYRDLVARWPRTLLILAPRHVERCGGIAREVRARGLTCQTLSGLQPETRPRNAQVVLVDVMGRLPDTYSIASVIFCGGSLAALGGQNILEAAVWGKPVLYGPSMEDFLDAQELLERSGGGMQVRDGRHLGEAVAHLLSHPGEARSMGRRARQALARNPGAARRHAEVILGLLG